MTIRSSALDFVARNVKFAALFVLVGPLVGGVAFGLATFLAARSTKAAMLLNPLFAPYYYVAGCIPALLCGLGVAVASLFIRSPRATYAAAILLGILTSAVPFALPMGAIDQAGLLMLMVVAFAGAVAALACTWLAFRLEWLE